VEFSWNVDGPPSSGWSLSGNGGTIPGTDFLGTTDNQPLDFRVNGLRALRLEPNATSPNTIGGHVENSVTSGVKGATISGGGTSGILKNEVTADYGTIGGGNSNLASGRDATVGGGAGNLASNVFATVGGGGANRASNLFATVGGGGNNRATGSQSTVSGGVTNAATSFYATVSGGQANSANGIYSTVPGGHLNVAGGSYSFAAGRNAKANHVGTFVWADGTGMVGADFASTAVDQFLVRAAGGTTFYSNRGLTAGVSLTSGAGAWASVSDRNRKHLFRTEDGESVLEKIAGIPIPSWTYKAQDASIRHLGPMAQDFYAAFGLGQDTLTITTSDISGVNMLAIQALERRTRDLDVMRAELRQRLAALETALARLEAVTESNQR